MTRTCRVRLGLVAVGTLLATLVTIQPGHSQPPGGIRGGGPPFGPPSMPGPPGGIGGRPGFSGISGIAGRPPGFPEPPRPPEFPRPPEIRPPGVGGGIGIGGGIGGGGPTIYEWRCGRCGRVLGTGPAPPPSAYCVACGTTNTFPGRRRRPRPAPDANPAADHPRRAAGAAPGHQRADDSAARRPLRPALHERLVVLTDVPRAGPASDRHHPGCAPASRGGNRRGGHGSGQEPAGEATPPAPAAAAVRR